MPSALTTLAMFATALYSLPAAGPTFVSSPSIFKLIVSPFTPIKELFVPAVGACDVFGLYVRVVLPQTTAISLGSIVNLISQNIFIIKSIK